MLHLTGYVKVKAYLSTLSLLVVEVEVMFNIP